MKISFKKSLPVTVIPFLSLLIFLLVAAPSVRAAVTVTYDWTYNGTVLYNTTNSIVWTGTGPGDNKKMNGNANVGNTTVTADVSEALQVISVNGTLENRAFGRRQQEADKKKGEEKSRQKGIKKLN